MATKIRYIGNIGSHNPKQNNIHVGVISESTVPLLNGRLIAFSVAGTDAGGINLHIQSQSYLQEAVTISKTSTFPESLLPEILTFAEYQSAGLAEARVGVVTDAGTRIAATTAFSNDISMLSVGYKEVAFGEILGGGVTIAEMETLLQYDVNEDGVIGAISALKKQVEANATKPLGYFDGIKAQLDGISPYAWPVVKWGGIAIGANVAVQALTGKPIIGKKGLIKL